MAKIDQLVDWRPFEKYLAKELKRGPAAAGQPPGEIEHPRHRGAHAHEDWPERDDANWRKHSLAWVEGNDVKLGYRPVHLDPLTTVDEGGIDLKKIEPKARVY